MADAFITRRGGRSGGAGGAELVIVGGTTSPEKATHNTIWINTNKEITSYALTATEPTNPVEGMAWVIIGKSGAVKMASPVGGDWITVYPLSAKQYVNGAWADVEAKSYQNGVWVDWITYLYNFGNNCAAITGGWSLKQSAYDGINFVENNGGGIMIFQRGATSEGIAGTNNPIDMSGYTKLCINMATTGNGPFLIGVMPSYDSLVFYAYKQYETETGYHVAEIDISNIDYGFIGFGTAQAGRQQGYLAIAQIYMC